MAKHPFIQFYVADFITDTIDLSAEEIGAYMLILLTMWKHGAKLPADHRKLARIARVSPRKWARIWGSLEGYFEEVNGHIINPRLQEEYKKASEKSLLRASAGSAGGRAKALKSNDPPLANAVAKGVANSYHSSAYFMDSEEW